MGIFFYFPEENVGEGKRRAERAKSFFSPFMCWWPFLPFIQEERRIGEKKLFFIHVRKWVSGTFPPLENFLLFVRVRGGGNGVGGGYYGKKFSSTLLAQPRAAREKSSILPQNPLSRMNFSALLPLTIPTSQSSDDDGFQEFLGPAKGFYFFRNLWTVKYSTERSPPTHTILICHTGQCLLRATNGRSILLGKSMNATAQKLASPSSGPFFPPYFWTFLLGSLFPSLFVICNISNLNGPAFWQTPALRKQKNKGL